MARTCIPPAWPRRGGEEERKGGEEERKGGEEERKGGEEERKGGEEERKGGEEERKGGEEERKAAVSLIDTYKYSLQQRGGHVIIKDTLPGSI